MDEDLKAYMDAMEKRIAGLINASEGRIMERVAGRIDASEDRMKTHVSESCQAVETKLLRAFHAWSRSMEVRVRTGASMVSAIDERLALAEERISDLERRRDSAA